MDLKDRLAELRRERGWSQDELALKLSVTRQAISKWERGVAVPSMENLVYIGRLYGVPLDELVNGEQQCEEPPATAVAVAEPETAPASRGFSPPRLVGTVVLAGCLLLVIIASVITICSAIFRVPEGPKESIIRMGDMEQDHIDISDADALIRKSVD